MDLRTTLAAIMGVGSLLVAGTMVTIAAVS
jgi:hypothetical protein